MSLCPLSCENYNDPCVPHCSCGQPGDERHCIKTESWNIRRNKAVAKDCVTLPRELAEEIVARHAVLKSLKSNPPDGIDTDDADCMEVTQWSNEMEWQRDKLNEAISKLSTILENKAEE